MTYKLGSMRIINSVIIHCSGSDNVRHDNIEVIRQWHLERGFDNVGYHYFINGLGQIQKGRDLSTVGAHCYGHNRLSIGICLHGEHDFKQSQFESLLKLLSELCDKFKISKDRVFPHNHFNKNKTCPNFDVTEVLKNFKEIE